MVLVYCCWIMARLGGGTLSRHWTRSKAWTAAFGLNRLNLFWALCIYILFRECCLWWCSLNPSDDIFHSWPLNFALLIKRRKWQAIIHFTSFRTTIPLSNRKKVICCPLVATNDRALWEACGSGLFFFFFKVPLCLFNLLTWPSFVIFS